MSGRVSGVVGMVSSCMPLPACTLQTHLMLRHQGMEAIGKRLGSHVLCSALRNNSKISYALRNALLQLRYGMMEAQAAAELVSIFV